jgi:hypothetical protein
MIYKITQDVFFEIALPINWRYKVGKNSFEFFFWHYLLLRMDVSFFIFLLLLLIQIVAIYIINYYGEKVFKLSPKFFLIKRSSDEALRCPSLNP